MASDKIIGRGVELRPIDDLDALLSFDPLSVDGRLVSVVPCVDRQRNAHASRTLVCHDMKNGYVGDRFSDGYEVEEGDTPFYIAHWPYIDVFNYFSHHHVTIPPKSWTDVAHRHGTKVIGTFITEWDDGAKICAKFLADDALLHKVVDALVSVASAYGFDGWLINIENGVDYEHLPALLRFVSELTTECRRVLGDRRSTVIWYDSVIASSGRLKWQDELNALNAPFFHSSDGILLNYTWKTGSLHQNVAATSTLDRHKAFVGLDVYGRNCEWYGGFDMVKGLASIDHVSEGRLSIGLFAIGWLYEHLPAHDYVANSHKFWRLLRAHLRPCNKLTVDDLPVSSDFRFGVTADATTTHRWINTADQSLCAHMLCQGESDVQMVGHWREGLYLNDYGSGTLVRLLCFDIPADATTTHTVNILIHLDLHDSDRRLLRDAWIVLQRSTEASHEIRVQHKFVDNLLIL